LLARASQADRRRDTRRKILIGAAILAALDHEGVPNLNSRAELLHWLEARLNRPYDRAAVEFDVRAAAK
jgi:acyl-coenzyme A thioesterase PaaI-like protein